MKKLCILVFTILQSISSYSQDITGKWNGILKVQGFDLRLSFNISKNGELFAATMDSPDQGAFGIPMTSAEVTGNSVKLTHLAAGIIYQGNLNSDEKITGTFTQAGQVFPLDLSRIMPEKPVIKRPQEPVKPYPYYCEDVVIHNNTDALDLAGTLTMPSKEGKFPAVILITGSGPENRDEELFGHKPFLVLADFLTRNGIAVLRFDDRGTNQSTGDFSKATSADFAKDVACIADYLRNRKEIDQANIGLIGHSEGGIIAPMVAAQDNNIAFIVLMAGTGIRGDELLVMQQEAIGKAMGNSEEDILKQNAINRELYNIVLQNDDSKLVEEKLRQRLSDMVKELPSSQKPEGLSDEEIINLVIKQTTNPWMQYFIRHDPSTVLEKVKCPVLAINGTKDLQVPYKVNLEAIKSALDKAGNKNVTIVELEGLNHLFQEADKGIPAEYASIEQTLSPKAMQVILEWINKTKRGI